jgi:phage/plasmid-like protein (TIGR03299 family)
MSHMIESMFYVGDKPWHGLGTPLKDPPTIGEALDLAGLNWKVTKKPTYYRRSLGIEGLSETGHFVTVRDNNEVLGNVGSKYEILQNVDAFAPFDVIKDYGYTLETAGSIDSGKRVWILAKTPDDYLVGDDKILDYVLLYTSHDGSSGSCFRDVFIRVVCQNTLSASLSGNKTFEYKLRHTSSIKNRVDDLVSKLHTRQGNISQAVDSMNSFLDIPMNDKDLDIYLDAVMPFLGNRHKESNKELGILTRNKALPVYNAIKEAFYNGRGNKGETLWDAYNAVTEYHDHIKSHKQDWVKATQFGASARYKKQAFFVASQIVKKHKKTMIGGVS